jgi:hypothetical protein
MIRNILILLEEYFWAGDLGGFQLATLAGYKTDHNKSLENSNIWRTLIYREYMESAPAGRSPSFGC